MQTIILPKLLNNPVYVAGLSSPLHVVAEILDAQDKPEHARAMRDAATICEVFTEVCLLKTAQLINEIHN